MKIVTKWQGKMRFEAANPAGELTCSMDSPSPVGDGSALSPKQLLLASICGCSGIDVASHMRKHKQNPSSLVIEAEAPKREGLPSTFDSVTLDFFFEGDVSPEHAIESVVKSQTLYCGVSAIVAAHCPIRYNVHLQGAKIHEGVSRFFEQ